MPRNTRRLCSLSALLPAMLIAACTVTSPAPAPVIVKVPVYKELPPDMTADCAEVQFPSDGIRSDLDGATMTAREKVRADCNANKLDAVRKALKHVP